MAGPLEWIFKLTDQMSGPAKKITAELHSVTGALRSVDTAAKATGSAAPSLESTRKAIEGIGGGLLMVGGVAAGAAAAIGAMSAGFGKAVVDAASFKSAALTSLELMLGNRDAARGFFGELTKFASATPFETKQIVDAGKSLIGGGFDPEEVKTILRGVGDVAAANNFDANVFGSIVQQLNQVRSIGKLAYEDLKQIGQASGGAVSLEKVYAAIAGELGKTTEEAKKLVSTGRVDAQTGIAAILESIRTGASGGNLGALTDKLSTSIPGLLSTLQSKFFDLVPSVEDSPGLQGLQKALKSVVDLLDEANPLGQQLRRAFDSLLGKTFGSLFAGGGAEGFIRKLVDGVELIANVLPPIIQGFKEFGGGLFDGMYAAFKPLLDVFRLSDGGADSLAGVAAGMRAIGAVLGWVLGIIGLGAGTIVALVGLISEAFATLPSSLSMIGTAIVDGLWGGLTSAWTGLLTRIRGLVDLLPAAVRSALGIASPSRVMMELGLFTGEGFALGIDRAANDVDASAADMAAAPTLAALAAGGRGAAGAAGASGGSATVTVNVDARGARGEDVVGIEEATRRAVLSALVEAGLSVGAAA